MTLYIGKCLNLKFNAAAPDAYTVIRRYRHSLLTLLLFFFQNMEQGFFENFREFLSHFLSVELFPVIFFVPFFCREFFYKCETSLLAGKQFEVQNIL